LLPFTIITDHPSGNPKAKNFLTVSFSLFKSSFSVPKIGVIPKKCLGMAGEVPFGKEEDFHLDFNYLISTWISTWISIV